MASVLTVLMIVRSSTILAVCGRSSLTHAPDLPYCLKLEDGRRDRQRTLARGHAGDALAHSDGIRQFDAAPLLQIGLVVEEVQSARDRRTGGDR